MEDIDGYQIKNIPRKYNQGKSIKHYIPTLKPKERVILAASAICTQREIATITGMSQQSVSKIMRKLKESSNI
jgi:hypothetical protein